MYEHLTNIEVTSKTVYFFKSQWKRLHEQTPISGSEYLYSTNIKITVENYGHIKSNIVKMGIGI